MRNRMFLVGLLMALIVSVSAQAQSEWHGFFLGGSAAFNSDGAALTVKDNFAPQFSAIVQLGEGSNTYYMPGLTWKSSNGWLQFEALSIYTQVATLNWGAIFVGGSTSPLTFSTNNGVKREDITAGGIDVGITIPLNRKAQRLYLATALKYHVSYNYDTSVPESDRVENAIILSVGIIGLNPFK